MKGPGPALVEVFAGARPTVKKLAPAPHSICGPWARRSRLRVHATQKCQHRHARVFNDFLVRLCIPSPGAITESGSGTQAEPPVSIDRGRTKTVDTTEQIVSKHGALKPALDNHLDGL